MFEDGDLEVVVPPRGERRRVVLLGGSNVQLFPETVLQDALAREAAHAAPGGRQVVNLGRAGYGSERVLVLLHDVLRRLEPDALVVYTGHNEFVEAGFRLELEAAGAGEPSWLEALRLYSLVHALLDDGAVARQDPDASGPGPEPLRRRDGAYEELSYDETLRFIDGYARNVEEIARVAADAGVPFVLCTVVSNAFTPPHGIAPPPGLDAGQRARLHELRARARRHTPERYRDALSPPVRLRVSKWGKAVLGSPKTTRKLARDPLGDVPTLRPLSGPLAEAPATSGRGGDSVEGAHWGDPRLWNPPVFEVLTTYRAILDQDPTGAERASLERAAAILEEALGIAPDHPGLHYDLGIALYVLGEVGRAREHLHAARRFDRAARRGHELMNDVIRRVAAAREGVALLDADALFTRWSPDGLVGYEVVLDHCHLQPGARVVLMELLVEPLARLLGGG